MNKLATNQFEVLRELRKLRKGHLLLLLGVFIAGRVIATKSDWSPKGWWATILVALVLVGLVVATAGRGPKSTQDGPPKTWLYMDVSMIVGAAALAHMVGTDSIGNLLSVTALFMAWGATLYWAGPQTQLIWLRSGKVDVGKWRDRANAQEGIADWIDIYQWASVFAMFRQMQAVRPSLRNASLRTRLRVHPTQYAYRLLRSAGIFDLWEKAETFILMIAPARTGKSEWAKAQAIELVRARTGNNQIGPYISTSTRSDMLIAVGPVRAAVGTVWVCDPSGSGVKSNVFWSVADGCWDFTTAQRRAGAFLPTKQDSQQESWDAKARPILAIMMRAIARSHQDDGGCYAMLDIPRWLSDPDGEEAMAEIAAALGTAPGYLQQNMEIELFYKLPKETRGGIISHICVPLAWLANPHTRHLGDAPLSRKVNGRRLRNPQLFDPLAFALSQDSLFVIAEDQVGGASIAGALVAEVMYSVREATKDPKLFPGGRLEPSMLCQFDEADRSCPIDLVKLTSYMAGHGVNMVAMFQNLAQLELGWGNKGAESIRSNANCTLFMGGMGVADDLRDAEVLMGEHLMVLDLDDRRFTATMSAGMIRSLQRGQAILMRQFMLPTVGRPDQFYLLMKKRNLLDMIMRRPGKYARELPVMPGWEVEMEPAAMYKPVFAAERLMDTAELEVIQAEGGQ